MHLLENPVRRYAWGSRTALPELLGVPADGGPQAELWLGAHPDSPSVLPDGTPLHDAVTAAPGTTLGERVHARYGPRLPYLLKVLAADEPLSIQVHPDADRAARRFAAEEAADLPASERSYTDPHHKPEMLLALTDFEALCGFRPLAAVLADLEGLDVPGVDELTAHLASGDDASALRGTLTWLLTGGAAVGDLAAALARAAATRRGPSHDDVLVRLDAAYPRDPGVLVALLLHHVRLAEGEALYLPAGNVHAYLRGSGVEIMAASDNVLRGGLTPKRVDVAELLAVVDFRVVEVPRVAPHRDGGVTTWRPGADEFELLDVVPGADPVEVAATGPRVVLCLEGAVRARCGTHDLVLRRGAAAFVPHDDGPLGLAATAEGPCRAVVAAVPGE